MRVHGLGWLGTRTEHFDEMVAFCRDILGLELQKEERGMTVFVLPDGSPFEIFTPDEPEHQAFTTGPVAGFVVDDVDAARAEMEERGTQFLGDTQRDGGFVWAHFRAPDGNVYELTKRPSGDSAGS